MAPLFAAACGGGTPASELVKPPEFDPGNQSKCAIKTSESKPLIVEWPSADRAELESQIASKQVVVRYEGCEMVLLSQCKAPGAYTYSSVTPKRDTIAIRNADELYATIPVGAARFEGNLERSGQLNVTMTTVGRYASNQPLVSRGELQGLCNGATHVVAGLTVGAFEFFAGADASVGGGASVLGAGAGAESSASREMLSADGDMPSCTAADRAQTAPPTGCGALLRVEVVPLSDEPPPPNAAARSATPASAAPSTEPGQPSPRPAEVVATEMVRIPAGKLMMGSNTGEANEKPVHAVAIAAFEIDKTEVTAGQYHQCVEAGSCRKLIMPMTECNGTSPIQKLPRRPDHPANCVGWQGAEEYCRWANKRLPTEAEWEYAARGTDGREYPWGKKKPDAQLCWMRKAGKEKGTCPVGSNAGDASPFGVLDLGGNVAEWTASDFCAYTTPGCASGVLKAVRGGSFATVDPKQARAAHRHKLASMVNNQPSIGFRCAR